MQQECEAVEIAKESQRSTILECTIALRSDMDLKSTHLETLNFNNKMALLGCRASTEIESIFRLHNASKLTYIYRRIFHSPRITKGGANTNGWVKLKSLSKHEWLIQLRSQPLEYLYTYTTTHPVYLHSLRPRNFSLYIREKRGCRIFRFAL